MIYYENYEEYKKEINSNTIMCLDIEVSSYWIDKGRIIQYNSKLDDEYYNSIEKGSCVYIWQFSIDDNIFYGREWNDFKTFLELIKQDVNIKEKESCYIYVHNFAYEFQFLRNLFNYEFEDVFARTIRKPMKARWKCFEFRCSYTLSNLSLSSWGKQLGIPKKSGDLNYLKIRTPYSKLSKKELEYCERDIQVMIQGIKKFIEKYKTISNIPLTSTGEIRRDIKKMFYKNNSYHHWITRLMPRTVEEYKVFKACFGGGDTHTNVIHSREVLEDVFSIDETSAYPGVMIRYKFPCTPFLKISLSRNDFDFEKYSYIFCLKLTNIKLKGTLSYIAKSRTLKCINPVLDNGRIVKSDEIIMYCTNYDLTHIRTLYDYEETFISIRRAKNGYLNSQFIDYVLTLFENKSTLRGVEGYEDIYMESKAKLNSCYGMAVTDPVFCSVSFNGDWSAIPQLEQDIQESLNDIKDKWYNNNFSYIVGVFTTSIARFELWNMILSMDPEDVCYFDTDSVKGLHFEKYEKLIKSKNKEIIEKTKLAMKHHHFKNRFIQKQPNGTKTILGTWDFEGIYKKAKFLGAKKYLVETEEGFHLTVSGVPKKAVSCIKSFEDFEEGFVFSADECMKGLSTYLDGNNPKVTMKDGYVVNQPFGLNIRNIGYTLGLTEEYKSIIRFMKEHGEI